MADNQRGPYLAGGFPGQALVKDLAGTNRTYWTDVGNIGYEKLTANRDYYVATTGSNENDGLTPGSAFRTIQYAIDVTRGLNVNAKAVKIYVADGTYPESLILPPIAGGIGSLNYAELATDISIIGNEASPANAIIGDIGAPLSELGTLHVQGGSWYVTGFRLIAGSGAGSFIGAFNRNAFLLAGRLQFVSPSSSVFVLLVSQGTILGGYGAWDLFGANWGGVFYVNGAGSEVSAPNVININDTPVIEASFGAFALVDGLSRLAISGVTFNGTMTGKRYAVSRNAIIDTNGGGPTYLPGDVAGTVATGGQYI